MCGSWLIMAPGPASTAQTAPAAHCTYIVAGYASPNGRAPAATSLQLCPLSELRYRRPSAPSQPIDGVLKHTVCGFIGAAIGCQVVPPSSVASSFPDSA